jgi:hypothetical protein
MMGGVVSVWVQAGTDAALAREGASTMASTTTYRGSAPSQGWRRHRSPTSMMSQHSYRVGCGRCRGLGGHC